MQLEPDQHEDSRRAMIALMVIMCLIVAYSVYMQATYTPPQTKEETKEETEEKTDREAESDESDADEEPKSPEKPKPKKKTPEKTEDQPSEKRPEKTERTKQEPSDTGEEQPPASLQPIARESALLAADFSPLNGAIQRLVLLDYYRTPIAKSKAQKAREESSDPDLAQYGLPLLGQAGTEQSVVLFDRPDYAWKKKRGDANALYLEAPIFEGDHVYQVVDQGAPRKVVFQATLADGRLQVTKTYQLPDPEGELRRHVDLSIELRNLDEERALHLPGYLLRGPGGIAAEQTPASWGEPQPTEEERERAAKDIYGFVATENKDGEVNVDRESVSSLEDEDLSATGARVRWAAVHSAYFAVILEPRVEEAEETFACRAGAQALGETNATAHIVADTITLPPGASVEHRYRLYAGPKAEQELAPYDAAYERILRRRWLDPLSNLMAWILRTVYSVIPNYGVAILVLTIIVRAALHPLSKKSQTSMQKMQKLQPQMQEIKEKYKGDRRRQQEETMKLYRQYGVNPLGGCLPLFLQIPVFIGLFRALRDSIELRHAPFVLWIRDLSQPDNLMPGINVLPLLCCLIMFVQQRMMPKSADPQQQQTQKIMGIMMPVFLGFIFYSLPSGLNLYFLATTLIGIGEQKLIRHHLDKMGPLKPVRQQPQKPGRKSSTRRTARSSKRKPF
ncbi:MAG: YidC/Oxa1 family insertase periplasmic-domain containing protein [bacterium]